MLIVFKCIFITFHLPPAFFERPFEAKRSFWEVKPEDVIDLTEYLFEQDEDAGREQEVTREELLEVILKIRGGREISNQDVSSRM